ncbi:hypothetical protein NDR87_19350 [Nocardia sp. CDC159]|uniref:Uncharacterized protein n=1 Tax=Nocardia pulmonis TaxID=2951408 RepID=A0A9X2E9I1_9NOCA|nr:MULTISPECIES: hypothetical protein [Nocardia]MCM6776151.1 hypothetical protein [Nocardia pulmonis]MCM6788522.1 hypothetical protein [Nocardia sp. CDC159]
MNTLKLDPVAMAAYTAIADTVSEQLAAAAAVAAGAVNPGQLSADLGLVGSEFAARFTAAVSEHAQALSTASRLVATYGQVLRDHNVASQGIDSGSAAAVTRAGEGEVSV